MSAITKKIFILAGEASGDLHGSNLIKHLKLKTQVSGGHIPPLHVNHVPPPLEIYGIGGDKMKEAGALEFFDLAHFHVTGLTDAIKKIPQYKKAEKIILEKIKRIRPNLIVLIDNPGFNLHLAPKIHALTIPIVYYISPQLWAWAPKRIYKIKKYVKKMLVLFDFEKALYEKHDIPVAFVGHPLKDVIQNSDLKSVKDQMTRRKNDRLVALLPGSRKGELKKLGAIFFGAAQRIADKLPQTTFCVIKSPTIPKAVYERLIAQSGIAATLVDKNPYDAIHSSDLAIVCSGTATLECALLEVPMIISNKGSFITYLAAKSLIRVPYLGMPNLILGRKGFPEFLQYDATPKKIAQEAIAILTHPQRLQRMKEDLKDVSRHLGEGGANEKAALEVLKILN